jgi:hypothetical protein
MKYLAALSTLITVESGMPSEFDPVLKASILKNYADVPLYLFSPTSERFNC